MDEKQLQNYLYKERSKIRNEARPLRLNSSQKRNFREFVKKESKTLKTALLLLVAATLIEIAIPLLSDLFVRKYAYFLEVDKLVQSLSLLSVLLLIYLVVAFYSIKMEKAFAIYFLNDLRHKWFSMFLNKPRRALRGGDKGKLFTKISYHFALLQMGITNSVFPAFNWLFLAIGLTVAGFFLNTELLIAVLVSIPVSLLIAFIGYVISKYYISQDQTLYSKILRYINDSLEEFDSIKINQKERMILDRFDKMVDLDTYFRIRRDLWLKYGGRIIFVLISLAAAAFYLFELYHPLLQVESSAEYIVYGIFYALIIKLIYLSLRVGIFSYAGILGLALCLPDQMVFDQSKNRPDLKINKLVLKSSKVRLARDREYSRNLEFEFAKGKRFLIVGETASGKSSLAEVLAGQASQSRGKPWVFKLNNGRLLYSKWFKIARSIYYIDGRYNSEDTLLSNFIGEEAKDVGSKKMQKMIDIFQYKHFKFLLENGRAIGRNVSKNSFTPVEKVLMQLAYAQLQKPPMLIIDNQWLDINDERINETLKMLSVKLKKTIFVCFAREDNSILKYDQKYSL